MRDGESVSYWRRRHEARFDLVAGVALAGLVVAVSLLAAAVLR